MGTKAGRLLNLTTRQWLYLLWGITLFIFVLFFLVYQLDSWPNIWWDEGWYLDAARNWIERGHLGHYIDGVSTPPRIPVRFPIVVPVALSMKILGIGIWQGRLPGVIFTILTMGLVFYLLNNIYSKRAGLISLITYFIIAPFIINPIIMGRLILAEMPMLFYLVGGYSLVYLAINRNAKWSIGASFLFGVALHAKLQVPPFWLVSIFLMLWMASTLRQRRLYLILTSITCGSIVFAVLIYWLQNIFMPGAFEEPALVKLLINSVIVVFNLQVRLVALFFVIIYALPQLLSLIWSGKRILPLLWLDLQGNTSKQNIDEANKNIIRIGLWGLGTSWFFWYMALGLSWGRYLFPPFFIGCIFFSAYLAEITEGLNPRLVLKLASRLIFHRNIHQKNIRSVIIIIIFSFSLGIIGNNIRGRIAPPNENSIATSIYLKEYIPPGSRIETFESELLFLAPELTFHIPSDLVSMEVNRRSSIDPRFIVNYDPLEYDPDYLVVGPTSRSWHFYDNVIEAGDCILIADVGNYQIYSIHSTGEK